MTKILLIIALLVIGFLHVGQVHASVKEAGEAGKLQIYNTDRSNEQADERVVKVQAILLKHRSPLAEYADTFVREADRNNLDWKLVVSIAGLESTFGKFVPNNSHNAWGWGIPTGASSGIGFQNWEEGIATVSRGLKTRYVDRGLITPEQMGPVYAASPVWSDKVRYFMNQIEELDAVDKRFIAMNW
jgi:hypothetical protein